MPTSIGYQDLAALIARQPAVTERWRAHVRSSTFSTIHATFSFPRPVGSAIPDPYFTQLASLDPRALDITGSIRLPSPIEPQAAAPNYEFPVVQRRLKGDRLPLASAPQTPVAPAQEPASRPPKLKDQASLTSDPKPALLPADASQSDAEPRQPQAPIARKGDREAPAPAAVAAPSMMPADDATLDRAAAMAGLAGEALATTGMLRKPIPMAENPAPTKPEAIAPVRKAEKQKPVRAPAADWALQRSGAVSQQVAQAAKQTSVKRKPEVAEKPAPEPLPQIAEVETPAAPQVAATRLPETEIADLESQRADVHGPLVVPPVPVAEAPKLEPAPQKREMAQNAPSESARGPKQIDRFQVVDSLAQYASPAPQSTRIYFGTHEIGFGKGGLQRWEPDEVPTVLAPPHVDPEIKRAALDLDPEAESETPGVTVAPKGEVTGEGRRPRTPAERLSLVGPSRVKHEKCLANAIYFEARGEVERGQMAVAQVILNRAFSGYYPGNVCDVVYQNAHRHLACQFTFACDNVRDVVREPDAWETASRVAREALDGKFWLPEVGKATHYHATYVNPWWVRTMTKHARLGIHIFYRPKRWGDGEEMPVWGDRLDVTGTVTPMDALSDKDSPAKRAAAQPTKLRSIFDPVEEIKPGG
ncbi:MAG: cell wall hydrolase [Pseudorhodoplanes sp.]